jgi:hypothetical protein
LPVFGLPRRATVTSADPRPADAAATFVTGGDDMAGPEPGGGSVGIDRDAGRLGPADGEPVAAHLDLERVT